MNLTVVFNLKGAYVVNLYKIQTRNSVDDEWVDQKPMKGWFNTIDLSYNEARSIVREYKELTKTKNYRTIKQGKNDTIMPCTICHKSIKVNEKSGSSDGGITHSHDDCRYKQFKQSGKST